MSKLQILIKIGLTSLFARKLRSLLSILGVVCGVMAVMSMISIGEGAKQKVLREIESLGLRNIYIDKIPLTEKQQFDALSRGSFGVSWSDVERLQHHKKYVKSVAAIREITVALLSTNSSVLPKIVQSTPNYLQIIGVTLAAGRFLLPIDEQNNNMVCVLGANLARQLGKDGRIGKTLRIGDALYRVIGIISKQSMHGDDQVKALADNYNETLFLPFPSHDKFSQMQAEKANHTLSRILVEVQSDENIPEVSQLIQRVIEVAHNNVRDYQVVVPQELLKQSLRTQRLFNIILAVIGGISLLVGGIGIMNIMLATVSERKYEIGLRRAVGATQRDVVAQFITESILLTLSGGVLGIGLGMTIIIGVEIVTGLPVRVTIAAMLIPFILAVLTGIFFGLYPAVQAARMDPIKSLRAV
ncbi:MAG: FtsX-like permease family protein [Desulfobacterales bacterium]|nr:FtsX-like permease family protein [Desulfobacterales bacterium]